MKSSLLDKIQNLWKSFKEGRADKRREVKALFNKASNEFMKLCRKYPEVKFIGNTTINCYLIPERKQVGGFIYTDNKDQSDSLFAGGKKYVFFQNNFILTKKPKRVKKYNGLSDFLINSTDKEKKKVFTKAAREANLEQGRLLKGKK